MYYIYIYKEICASSWKLTKDIILFQVWHNTVLERQRVLNLA